REAEGGAGEYRYHGEAERQVGRRRGVGGGQGDAAGGRCAADQVPFHLYGEQGAVEGDPAVRAARYGKELPCEGCGDGDGGHLLQRQEFRSSVEVDGRVRKASPQPLPLLFSFATS